MFKPKKKSERKGGGGKKVPSSQKKKKKTQEKKKNEVESEQLIKPKDLESPRPPGLEKKAEDSGTDETIFYVNRSGGDVTHPTFTSPPSPRERVIVHNDLDEESSSSDESIDDEDLLYESIGTWSEMMLNFTEEKHRAAWVTTNLLLERHQLQHYFNSVQALRLATSASSIKRRQRVIKHLKTSIISSQELYTHQEELLDSPDSTYIQSPPSLKYLAVVVILNHMRRFRLNFVVDSIHEKEVSKALQLSDVDHNVKRGVGPNSLRGAFLYAFGQSVQRVFVELGLEFSLTSEGSPQREENKAAATANMTLAHSSSSPPRKIASPPLQKKKEKNLDVEGEEKKGDDDDDDDDLIELKEGEDDEFLVNYRPGEEEPGEEEGILKGEEEESKTMVSEWCDDDHETQVFKIVVLGGGGVGKSALLQQLVSRTFRHEYDPTVEDNYYLTIVVDGIPTKLQILDSAGQSEYVPLRSYYMAHADGFLVLYAVNSVTSFHEALEYPDQIFRVKGVELENQSRSEQQKSGSIIRRVRGKFNLGDDPELQQDPVPILMVGTKIDLEGKRRIPKEHAQKKASVYHCFSQVEVSNRTGHNVLKCFEIIVRQIRENTKEVESRQDIQLRKQKWKHIKSEIANREKIERKKEKMLKKARQEWNKSQAKRIQEANHGGPPKEEIEEEEKKKKEEVLKEAKVIEPHALMPKFIKNRQDIEIFPPNIEVIDSNAHCFYFEFSSFSVNLGIAAQIPPPLEFFFSIWNRKTLEMLTEEFCVPISSHDQIMFRNSSVIIPLPLCQAIFKDFPDDIDLFDLALVSRLNTIGKLQVDETEAIENARIPYGYGVVPVPDLIAINHEGITQTDVDGISKKRCSSPNPDEDEEEEKDSRAKRKKNIQIQTMAVQLYMRPMSQSVKEFCGLLLSHFPNIQETSFPYVGKVEISLFQDPLPNEHAHLGLLRRIAIPPPLVLGRTCNSLHATSSQSFAKTTNKLHVTIVGGMFPSIPSDYVTPQLTVSVRILSGWELSRVLSVGVAREPLDFSKEIRKSETVLTIDQIPTNHPEWSETITLNLDEVQNLAHLYFKATFFPTSEDWPPLHTFLKLETDDGFIADGLYRLKCFSKPPEAGADPVFYLKDHHPKPRKEKEKKGKGKGKKGSTVRTGATEREGDDEEPDYIVIRTRLCSFTKTQDRKMNNIVQFKAFPSKMYSTFLRDLINGDVPRVELFRLLPRLISVFFSLFASEKHKSILPLAEDAFGSVIAQFLEPDKSKELIPTYRHRATPKFIQKSDVRQETEKSVQGEIWEVDEGKKEKEKEEEKEVKKEEKKGEKMEEKEEERKDQEAKKRKRKRKRKRKISLPEEERKKEEKREEEKEEMIVKEKEEKKEEEKSITKRKRKRKRTRKRKIDKSEEEIEKEKEEKKKEREKERRKERRLTTNLDAYSVMKMRKTFKALEQEEVEKEEKRKKKENGSGIRKKPKNIQSLDLAKIEEKEEEEEDFREETDIKLFPCLLGYTLLTYECPVNFATKARKLFCKYFRLFIEKQDPDAYKFSPNLTELDYPTYDQYLGILLSDWTPETIRDVIERNYKHRTKQRKQNRVRFDIPSVLDNVGGGGSRKHLRTIGVSRSLQSLPTSSTTATTHFDLLPKTNPSSSPLRDKRIVVSVEDFNVTEWLKSLHLSRYDAIFRKSGFDSFAKIQELAMEDLDRMNVKIPRHRNLLLKESSLLV